VKRKANERREFRARAGLTQIEVIILIGVIMALVLWALSGTPAPSRAKAGRIKCVNNLKRIGLAFRVFSTDHGDRFPAEILLSNGVEMASIDIVKVLGALTNELGDPKILVCPEDKTRTVAASLTNITGRNVSYFLSLSARETEPQVFLGGDRNIATNGVAVGAGLFPLTTNSAVSWTKEIHVNQGDIVMGDGSVQQMSANRLMQAVRDQELETNWLVFPSMK
jgi:hypothetical protein